MAKLKSLISESNFRYQCLRHQELTNFRGSNYAIFPALQFGDSYGLMLGAGTNFFTSLASVFCDL